MEYFNSCEIVTDAILTLEEEIFKMEDSDSKTKCIISLFAINGWLPLEFIKSIEKERINRGVDRAS